MKKIYLFHILFQPCLYIFLCLFITIPLSSQAAQKFVSGVIIVHVRSTTGPQYKTLAKVETGEPVEVIEEKGYMSKIKTENNVIGWIPSQYLKSDPPAQSIIAELKKELADLKEKKESAINTTTDEISSELKKKIEQLKSENTRLQENNQKLLTSIQENQGLDSGYAEQKIKDLKEKVQLLQARLAGSDTNTADSFEKEKNSLKKEVASLRSDLTSLRERNKKLEKNKMLHWFFAGATVFFLGLLSSKFLGQKKNKLTF